MYLGRSKDLLAVLFSTRLSLSSLLASTDRTKMTLSADHLNPSVILQKVGILQVWKWISGLTVFP